MERAPIDPLAPDAATRQTGGAGMWRGAQSARLELGQVILYHAATHSADVRTLGRGGRTLPSVPQKRVSPNDHALLEPGTLVVINWDLGFMPIIDGVITIVGPQLEALGDTSALGVSGYGVEDPVQPVEGNSNYRPANAPPDLMAGDYAKQGDRGQLIALLRGGLAMLGSPTSSIESYGLSGLLRLIGQRLQTVTDFGQWDTLSQDGKTSFRLRAGSDVSTETGYAEEKWTIRFDLGATGDILNLELTNPEGQVLFGFRVSADGHWQTYSAAGSDHMTGASAFGAAEEHLGDKTARIGGNEARTVDGNAKRAVGGSLGEDVAGNRSDTVGNDYTQVINRNATVNVAGKTVQVFAGGSAAEATPGSNALETSLINGGWLIDIGDPKKGANISAQAAFTLRTQMGDITLESGANATVKARQTATVEGLKVKLGENAQYALPIWPTFRQDLFQFLTILIPSLMTDIAVAKPLQLTAQQANLQKFISQLASPGVYDSKKVENE